MTPEQIIFVMSARVQLLQDALRKGNVHAAGAQLDRIDYLADRLIYGLPDSAEGFNLRHSKWQRSTLHTFEERYI